MSLLEEMRAAAEPHGSKCGTAAILQALDDDDRKDLEAALGDPAITGTAIAKVLARIGHRISAQSITRHRRGECRCPA